MTQMPCKYCDDHQQILYDKYAPEGKKTTNLDGTHHTHNKLQQQPQQQQQTTITDNVVRAESGLDKKGWEIAHQENMAASERLAKAIDGLTAKLDEIAKAYFGSGTQ